MGKSTINIYKSPFSIAMLVITRGYPQWSFGPLHPLVPVVAGHGFRFQAGSLRALGRHDMGIGGSLASAKSGENPPTLWWTYKKQWKMAIEIVDFPIKNGDFPWQNVSSPEGKTRGWLLQQVGLLLGTSWHFEFCLLFGRQATVVAWKLLQPCRTKGALRCNADKLVGSGKVQKQSPTVEVSMIWQLG